MRWKTFGAYRVERRFCTSHPWEVWKGLSFVQAFITEGEACNFASLSQEADSYPPALESRKAGKHA